MYTPKYTQQTDFSKETLGDIRIRQQELIKARNEMQHEMNCNAQESILIQQVLQGFMNAVGYPAPTFPPQFMNGPQFGFQAPAGYGKVGEPLAGQNSQCNHSHNLNLNEVFKSRVAFNGEEFDRLNIFKRNALNFLQGRLEALEAAYVANDQPRDKLTDAVKLEIANIKDFLNNYN